MVIKRLIAFIVLVGLLVSLCPARAQVAHEDPDRVPVRDPYDADRKLAAALQEMFGSLDSFAEHINASDFSASERDVRLFAMAHGNFTEVYEKADFAGSDMEAIADRLATMEADLRAALNSSERYGADARQREDYMTVNDVRGAQELAARMQLSYRDVSEALGKVNANTTYILEALGDDEVDTTGLENGVTGLQGYSSRMEEKARQSSVGDASLSLAVNRQQAGSGDWVTLTATLATANVPPVGRTIRFYFNDIPVGSAVTNWAGTCAVVWQVNDRSFDRIVHARAELDPQGTGLFPAMANAEIARSPEQASLTTLVNPRAATCGEQVYVYGTLMGISGVPAAGKPVTVLVAGAPAGNATTGEDGAYSTLVTIGPEAPAPECIITTAYEGALDSALLGTTSSPGLVIVTPVATLTTLAPVRNVYRGGDLATFEGTLVTGAGEPVLGANVSVFAGDGLIGTGPTDADGRFRFTGPVPFDIEPGDQDVYACFDPGDGRALSGSRSAAYTARFEPVDPQASVHGIPLLAFPGDELNITVVAMAGSGPLAERLLTLRFPGALDEAVVTDDGGCGQLLYEVAGFGIYRLHVVTPEEGLLTGADLGTSVMLVMPFGRTGMALVLLAAVLLTGVAVLKRYSHRRAHQPPARPVLPPSSPGEPEAKPAWRSIEKELNEISEALLGEGDRRGAILSIYQTARRMLRDLDPALPESATHRELQRTLSGRRPSISAPLGVITRSYEGAAFRQSQPTDEDVQRSLHSLKEIIGQIYATGGARP